MEKDKIVTRMSILCTFVIALIVIIILVNIWKPDKTTKNKNLSFEYDDTIEYKKKGYEAIYSDVRSLLYESNVSTLYEKMDQTFLDDNLLTEENFKDYLVRNSLIGTNIKFLSYNYYEGSENVTYIVKYTLTDTSNSTQTKTINIIESSPYNYTLSFETYTIPTKDKLKIDTAVEGLEIKVTLMERKENYVKFALSVKNVSSDTINIDFRDLNTVYLQLSNNRDIKQTGIVTSDSANVTLKNGNYVNRELTYNVNLDNQGLIKSMVFSNITINSKSKTIKIDF